ncbi:hypothetical protein EV207_12525 [Scopulibacillus darangshiensis]|uniref:Uncharacterized protein n=1 Tax=Scopulibacillus darangshiensis TaxID=442528 RepID=A0A4R2NST9_9BACL|nr:hypothetical protein EV207_12525 [Scopulibacillus darangshiensis]
MKTILKGILIAFIISFVINHFFLFPALFTYIGIVAFISMIIIYRIARLILKIVH